MNEKLAVTSERVDDIPLLLAQLELMGVQPLLDEHFPTHGNWQGLSLGGVAVIWLTHILSQADHRLNQVQAWADKRLQTLRCCTAQPVTALDFSDDRLAQVLRSLSEDARWDSFEAELSQHLLRVYDLSPEMVRLDSSTTSGYWQVDPEGLFQLGHSKDRRPDLPQVKVMLATLDPLGMPVATTVLAGNRADDPLYIPAVRQVRLSLGRRGLLYVGDCKMAALQTRAVVQAGGDFYLCPLSATQLNQAELEAYLAPVWAGQQALCPIYRERAEGELEGIAEGYEAQERLTAVVEGETITWNERRLVVRSLKQAQGAKVALEARLAKAQAAVAALNQRGRGKRRFTGVAPLRQTAEAILERHQVQGLVQLSYLEQRHRRTVRRYRERPQRTQLEREVTVRAVVDDLAVAAAVRCLGWRVYVSNAPGQKLSLSQAVLAYRGEYIIERGFGRLKGKPLSLRPMYLQRQDHATGLIRLLSLGLRVLTLLDFLVRRQLAAAGAKLAGVYAGNPKRATARPTAERLLKAFQEITLTVIGQAHQIQQYLTPLSELQQRILALLDLPPDIYTRLCPDSTKPP